MSKIGKGNKAIAVILPEEVYNDLKKWADEKDWSISQAGKNLIAKGLKEELDPATNKQKK